MTLSSYSMLVPMFTKSLFSLDVLPLCQAFFFFFLPFFLFVSKSVVGLHTEICLWCEQLNSCM